MDYSALSEAQQQQYCSSQQQQQQQDPHYDQHAAYAQSYAAYYAAYHQNQQQDPSQYHQQQYGASAYPHNNYHQYYYSGQDSSYYQAGTAQPQTEGVGPANPSQIYAASVAAAPPQGQQHGLNQAAATAADAALSQQSQLAEAHRHWDGNGGPPKPGSRGRGRSSNRGGGTRGGVSFRGGGRGRGRGRGLMGRSRGRKSSQSAPEIATVGEQSRRPVLPVVWCDICRVDCSSLESLEQHKSGKRHKKTVQRVDEIQKQQRLFDEMQAKVMPEMAIPNSEAEPAAVQTKEVYQSSSVVGITPNAPYLSAQQVGGNATMVSTAHEITSSADFEIAAQTKVAKEEMVTEASPSDAAGSLTEGQQGRPKFGGRRGGLKRQMTRFGRGGKRPKTFDRVPDQPRVCTLCNVICDTLAVFECHLSGKKHMSKMMRLQRQGSVYGPITVYIPPNQPSTWKGQEPLFYGLKCHEMLQQEASADPNGLQVGNYGLPHYPSEGTRDAEIGGPNSQAMEILDYPDGEFVAAKEDKEGLSLLGNNNTVTQDSVALDSEIEDPSLAPPIASSAYETNSEAVVPFTTGEYVIPLPEFGDHLGDGVRLPGLGAEVEELVPNTEELA